MEMCEGRDLGQSVPAAKSDAKQYEPNNHKLLIGIVGYSFISITSTKKHAFI